MTAEEIKKEIAALERLSTIGPMSSAGRFLMKVAGLKRKLMEMEKGEK